jgi:uncharacterized protein YdeI (YjbR/CyaY-like superfamily)
MKLGKTLYVSTRAAWRSWLSKHHATDKEIWLVYYRKDTGRPRISYNDAVEEALCFGWIDSTAKTVDARRFAQRFSPRKPRSNLSEMNRERIRRLLARKKMTAAGLAAVRHAFEPPARAGRGKAVSGVKIAADVARALRAHAATWRNFRGFPESYKRVRIGWIEGARNRKAEFNKRLRYFVRMTAKNKRFGMVQ